MAATWQQIYEGETDTNSPLSQTLMDKVRENLDYLYQTGAQLKYFQFHHAGVTNWWTAVLDNTIDWRDRNIQVIMVGYCGLNAAIISLLVGNANDKYWHTSIDVHGSAFGIIGNVNGDAIIEEQLYSRLGIPDPGVGAGALAEPYVSSSYVGGQLAVMDVFVDDTNHDVMVRFNALGGVGWREGAGLGRLIYSEDLGGH